MQENSTSLFVGCMFVLWQNKPPWIVFKIQGGVERKVKTCIDV